MAYIEQELNMNGLVPGGGNKEFKNHKLGIGDNLFRILPPFGTNHNGLPFAEVYLHWFQDPAGKNRPLACSKKTERYCPVCESANEVYQQIESVLSDFKGTDGKIRWDAMSAEVKEKNNILRKQFDALKAQRGYYYNAMDMNGTIGVLRLSKTAAEKLGQKILEAINSLGINPLSLKAGVLFNIMQKQKPGTKDKRDVEYDVDFVRKNVQTEDGIVQKIEKSAVPDSVINNFENLAYDVHAMYPARTAQELKRVMLGDKKVWLEMDAKRDARKTVAKTEVDVSVTNGQGETTIKESPAVTATNVTVPTDTGNNVTMATPPASTPTKPEAPKAAEADDFDALKRELGLA